MYKRIVFIVHRGVHDRGDGEKYHFHSIDVKTKENVMFAVPTTFFREGEQTPDFYDFAIVGHRDDGEWRRLTQQERKWLKEKKDWSICREGLKSRCVVVGDIVRVIRKGHLTLPTTLVVDLRDCVFSDGFLVHRDTGLEVPGEMFVRSMNALQPVHGRVVVDGELQPWRLVQRDVLKPKGEMVVDYQLGDLMPKLEMLSE